MTLAKAADSADRFKDDELRRLEAMFERSPNFVCLLDGPEHRFVLVNPAYQRLVGDRNYIGLPAREAVSDAEGQGFFEVLDEVFTTGEAFSGQNIPLLVQPSPDAPAETRLLDFVYQPLRNADGNVTSIFVDGVDVTQRQDAQQAYLQSQARLNKINVDVEREVSARAKTRSRTWTLSPDLLAVLTADGYFEAANPAWETVLGWDENEILRMSIFELVHPADIDHARAAFGLTVQDPPALRFANRCRCRDGSYRWISWVGIPEDGSVYCTGRDITAERAAAAGLSKAQDSMLHAARLETIGRLSGGIAHDFNNHLATILGALDLSRRQIAAGRTEEIGALLDAASDSAQKAALLTHRMLTLARSQPLEAKPVHVDHLIRNMEDLLWRSLRAIIRMEFLIAPDLWTALCDDSQLENAVLNLVINGRDAMPHGGTLRIEAHNTTVDAASGGLDCLKHGGYVVVSVTDNGVGMSPELAAKAVEPFFTTKGIGEGAGLGLAMVDRFAKQCGGDMLIQSEVGRGTTVCLYLPRAPDETAEP